MAKTNNPRSDGKRLNPDDDAASKAGGSTFEQLERASKKGALFDRVGAAFHDALVTSRGGGGRARSVDDKGKSAAPAIASDLAIRRPKNEPRQRMIVPEGVVIEGSLTSGSETEISGRVNGNVAVEGLLHLGAKAIISGSVRAASCKTEGLVEGKMECSQDLELSHTSRVNADAVAGNQVLVAGKVLGNISSSGTVRLAPTCAVEGDINAKQLVIEEGAMLNGRCSQRAPVQREAT